jgi:hypothetical protein
MSFAHCKNTEVNPSSLVGVIDWADSSGEKTMMKFIHELEDGYKKFTTISSQDQQESIRKKADEYHLYLYNPVQYAQYGSEESQSAYDIYRKHEKYVSLEQLASQSAELIEETLEYALKYDYDALFGATGVKIAEVVNEIFSIPYSRIVAQQSVDYAANMIKSSADLAIAQQAAFYNTKVQGRSFKQIYYMVLRGFNSAEESYQEAKKSVKKERSHPTSN